MTLTVVYQQTAVAGMRHLQRADKEAFALAGRVIAALAGDTQPPGAVLWGTSGLYRLHEGSLRVLYQVDGDKQAIYVLDVSVVS
jgi:mRNA-degrading endonuclease RelE of RelBE toxin-antitoxin system